MGRIVPWLDDRIERIVDTFWDTDVREATASASARSFIKKEGVYDEVRLFLVVVIRRDVVTPDEWGDLFNVSTQTAEEVRETA
jgi:hypothetical protein